MAKEWRLIGTNASEFGDIRTWKEKKRDAARQMKTFNRLMAKTEVRSYEKMTEDAERAYDIKMKEDTALLQAFVDKKLKSKALIKKAKNLKKKQKDNKINKE